MKPKWKSANLRWLSQAEGGREQPPHGPEYAATARFFGDNPKNLFSVLVQLPNRSVAANDTWTVRIAILVPERLPQVVERFRAGQHLIITEGPRPVAECRLGRAGKKVAARAKVTC